MFSRTTSGSSLDLPWKECIARGQALSTGLIEFSSLCMIMLPKHAELWFPGYAGSLLRNKPPAKRIWVAVTDHYEPFGGNVTLTQAIRRVETWNTLWPMIAELAPLDSRGRKPCFTFFYPQEEYNFEVMERITRMVRQGVADVEVHMHHANETAGSFWRKIDTFCSQLHEEHGLLRKHNGQISFGFIHGNWALDNSLPNNAWCGLNGELKLLSDLGCYADFTMPSIPSASQSKIVNKIYWATGNAKERRGFDQGMEASVGGGRHGTMLMLTGPVGLRFDRIGFHRKWWPRIESGELAVNDPPTKYRVNLWLERAPRIGSDIFIKLFGHSAREDNAETLLGTADREGSLINMFRWLHNAATEQRMEICWVSAYEMYCAVDALVSPAAGLLSDNVPC